MSAPFASKHLPLRDFRGKTTHMKSTPHLHTYGARSAFYLHNQYEIHQSNGGRLMITGALLHELPQWGVLHQPAASS